MKRYLLFFCTMAVCAVLMLGQRPQRQWLAGDSHIHSHWSAQYDETQNPPQPSVGGDGRYTTPQNAEKAREFGLSWMVTTDHGGPNHSKLNLQDAYAELTLSRLAVPQVLQFYGMELNMPAMDHHTLIIPNTPDEWKVLFNIESQFDADEEWPTNPSRDSEAATFQALSFMNALRRLPLLFANHPSRSAKGIGQYGLDEPREFRNNNDLAPGLYRGMEGAPGHQAATLRPDGTLRVDEEGLPTGNRGSYRNENARTFGGFDQMTAIVGGLWDSMLGEGRRFWIVATSDSHKNFADPLSSGNDFWPGQFHKIWVHAEKSYEGILDGLRAGRIFVAAGDLIRDLDVNVEANGDQATTGGTLTVTKGTDVRVTIRFRDPETPNPHGDIPTVQRVDLISGDITGPARDRNSDRNETTRVTKRFTASDWRASGDLRTITTVMPAVERSFYLRIRGTGGEELEPTMDPPGENPWLDLWFYSNPVFVEVN